MSEETPPSPGGSPTSKHHEEKPTASPIGTPSSNVGEHPRPTASPPPTGELTSNQLGLETDLFLAPRKPRKKKEKDHVKYLDGAPLPKKVKKTFTEKDLTDLHYPVTTPPNEWHKPRVAVNILTLLRPGFLNQCLESIARYETPFQIYIVNQGDNSPEQRRVIDYWIEELGVIEHFNDPPKWPGPARAEAFTLRQREGYEYIITFDDDCSLIGDSINGLVKAADENPEFHAISGYLLAPRRGGLRQYLLGGTITPTSNKHRYTNYDWKPGVHETDYICNGFRLVRLNPLILPDREYTMGLTDFDWSAAAKHVGLRLATCGDAGAYHKVMLDQRKPYFQENPLPYHRIRRNREAIMAMRDRFMNKWHYRI